MAVEIFTIGASRIPEFQPAAAALRIEVFREFPYLYDGDQDYEERYLQVYAQSAGSVWVLAVDDARVVGLSTGIPLLDEGPELQAPFLEKGLAPAPVFYFGESVLLPGYRGQGLGHRFFDEREAHARGLGFEWAAFAAVDRALTDPRRPPGHRDLGPFWTARGYERQPAMRFWLSWKEIGEAQESPKPLTYWLRRLDGLPTVSAGLK